jgi:hypothetical protein
MQYIKSLIIITTIIFTLTSCGGGGSSSDDDIVGLGGLAQKGPFVQGSTVNAYQLQNGIRNGGTATTTISNNLGAYDFGTLAWSGATEVEIVGKYFNENTNTNTATVGTLTSIVNVAGKTNFNVNVFTSLAAEKVKDLLASGKTITQAKSEAETAIKELFGLDSSVEIDKLDITKKGDNAAAAAEMLRVSAAIAASPTILISLADDIKDKSNVRGGDAFQNLETELTTVDNNFATITANIGSLTGNADDVPDTISTNTAPVITFSTNTITINEDSSAITRTLTATDAQNDTITFSAQSSDATKAGVSVSGDELTITPVANANGTLTITIGASDGKFSTYSEFELDITAVNDKPVITPNQSFAIAENSSSGVEVGTVVATDIENDSLSNWTIASGNTGSAFSISSAGVIEVVGSLDTETTGSYTLGITVSDGTNTSNEVQVNIDITNVNEAPALTKPSDISTTYGTNATTISLSGSDVDSTALTYSASASDTGIASTSVNGSDISITPQGAGNTIITASVNDGEFTTQQTLTITVAKKAITLTANEATKVYNTANPTFTHDNNGVESGDTFSGSLATIATLTSNVGTYDITSTLANANYDITFIGTNKFSITKANQADITVNNLEKDATDANFVPDIASGGNGTGTVVATASSEPNVATITAGVIDILGAGNTTITVYKAGDGNYNDSNPTTFDLTVVAQAQQASGKAIDGFLAKSSVCLDLNVNDACDQDEPTTKTGSDGAYTLTFSAEVQQHSNFKTSPILVVGGTDVGLDVTNPDNKPFVGSLKALNTIDEGAEINLTPATKLLANKVVAKRKEAEANSGTFSEQALTDFVEAEEPKIKKALKIPTDKPLNVDISQAENRDIYQQSLSIHKALEAMVESQVEAQKISTATAKTSTEIMNDIYEVAFDAISAADGAGAFDNPASSTVAIIFDKITTDASLTAKVQQGAQKAIKKAQKIGENIDKLFTGFKEDINTQSATVELADLEKIEEIIELEFEALEKELQDFDFASGLDLTETVKITIDDDLSDDVFLRSQDAFEDLIAVEKLQFDERFEAIADDVLKTIVDAIQEESTQTAVVDLFDDFTEFENVLANIDTSTFSGTATSAFDLIDDFIEDEKQEQAEEAREKELEQAKNANGYSITLPYDIYGIDSWEDNGVRTVEYWQATLKADNTLVMQEQVASSTGWVNDTDNNSDLELDNGSWVAEKFDNGNVTFEILNDNRILLKIDNVNYEKLKTFESDISGETIYDAELDRYIAMPQGAKRVLMSIERMQDTYRIWQPMYSYDNCDQNGCDKNTILNFAALIDKMCAGERGWFSGNYEGGYGFAGTSQQPSEENDWRNYSCDNQATSGTLFEIKNNYYSGSEIISQNAGTWEIKSVGGVGGVDILIVKPKNPYKYNDANDGLEYKIFTIYENKVWEGVFEPKGEGDSWYAYNDVAINTIKPIALKVHQDSLNNSGNSGDDDSSGGDNSGGGDNGGGQTLTINPPTTYAMSNTDGQQSVVLTTLSTLAFKIVNYTNNTIGNLGISFGDATPIGNYATRTSLVINPGNNYGSVDVGLQARNSDGVESNIATITITVNDGGNNGGGGNSTPTNFVELISQRCGTNGDFDKHETNNDLYLAFECPTDSSATSGNLVSVDRSDWDNPNITGNAGTWAITQVHGVNILQTNPTNPNDWDDDGDKTIFAVKDGFVWHGEKEIFPQNLSFVAHNEIAFNAMKNSAIAMTKTGTSTDVDTIPNDATQITDLSTSMPAKLYWDFYFRYYGDDTGYLLQTDYDVINTSTAKLQNTVMKYENSSWVSATPNTEYYLTASGWVAEGENVDYTLTNNNTIMNIAHYGDFKFWTKDVSNESIDVLGASITLPNNSQRIYLKKVDSDTDVYYLWEQVQ